MVARVWPYVFSIAFLVAYNLSWAKERIAAKVHHCHDGDTCRIEVSDSLWLNVRLAGIDAPEVKNSRFKQDQPLGGAARDYLNELVKGKEVMVEQLDLDGYNRPIVELYLGKDLVNTQLVAQGYAEVYRGATKRLKKDAYFAAERDAKDAKRGIWSLTNYVAPQTYRSQARK